MDLIQYFTVTLNSGVNSVMEGYGSVKESQSRPSVCLFFTLERQKLNREMKLMCDCHESRCHHSPAKFNQ